MTGVEGAAVVAAARLQRRRAENCMVDSAGGECEGGAGARGLYRAGARDFQVISFPGLQGVTTV